ncbi:unnamed protein product [Blepharisma stoltei]|uniref:C2H2-type domain-containing protein n=1 Tax=Blepharisma stoltei TaxID=1481888 RepID=A0AAU9K2R3_9CILI|nr:unnamed protein product [Blepharisma stoltei]
MGQPQRRKKKTAGDKSKHRAIKQKHYDKDIDQVHHDLKPEVAQKLISQPLDEDLPGQGQFYCIECARYFIDNTALLHHKKDKAHKKRVRELKEVPYSQEEAERCAGMTK